MLPIYIIIPVYNTERYIEQTVDSVLKQKYNNIKIILVDDGSTDQSSVICDKLAATHSFIHVIHQNNGGVSRARNAGISYILEQDIKDAYLAFLDSDDLWHPFFLDDNVVNNLKQLYDICAFGMVNCNERATRFSSPELYEEHHISGGISSIWSLTGHFAANLYHISLFRKYNIRFFEKYRYSEDKYFKVLCSFFAENIAFYPRIMYIYREVGSGAMGNALRVRATDYFLPIIDGWMYTEKVINSASEQFGITTDIGHVLGNVYLLDMISTHYMQQGSYTEIRNIVEQHPNYLFLQEMKPMKNKDVNYEKKEFYFKHPLSFALKYRLIGMIRCVLLFMRRIPIIRQLYYLRKYPLEELS